MNARVPTSAALERLRGVISELGSVLVAFSGGVDSALVVAVAREVLGDEAVAITADSLTFPTEEAEQARRFADDVGIRHLVVDSNELEVEGYARNDGARCYFCKSELFALAEARRAELGLAWLADGTNVDDLGDHRPGLKAAAELRVRHPLVEAGLSKRDVREVALSLGVEVWDKPSFACLGSRFPTGTRVTADKVRKVASVESELRKLGFRQFRLRWHELGSDVLARIELDPHDLERAGAPGVRERLVAVGRAVGFRWVTLDLAGYQSPEQTMEDLRERLRAQRAAGGSSQRS